MHRIARWLIVVYGFLSLPAAGSAQSPQDETTNEPESIALVQTPPTSRIVDLTHAFDPDTIYWPTESGFKLIRGPAGFTENGYYYAANRFEAAEHGGTHIDAPIHFFQDRHTVDQIPLEKLIGDAVVVDITQSCAQDSDYQADVRDLRRWETKHQRQLIDVIVLLRTGFGRHWNNRPRYLGTDKKGPAAVADLHFPGLDPAAARWLVEHRAIKAIGIDTASIDYGQSSRFQSHVTLFKHNIPVFENVANLHHWWVPGPGWQHFQSHVTLFKHNIPVFENVANLDQVPTSGATVIALPMKIGGGSGAPLRIIAAVQK